MTDPVTLQHRLPGGFLRLSKPGYAYAYLTLVLILKGACSHFREKMSFID